VHEASRLPIDIERPGFVQVEQHFGAKLAGERGDFGGEARHWQFAVGVAGVLAVQVAFALAFAEEAHDGEFIRPPYHGEHATGGRPVRRGGGGEPATGLVAVHAAEHHQRWAIEAARVDDGGRFPLRARHERAYLGAGGARSWRGGGSGRWRCGWAW